MSKLLSVVFVFAISSQVLAAGLHHEVVCKILQNNPYPQQSLAKTWPVIMSPLPKEDPKVGHFSDTIYDIDVSVISNNANKDVGQVTVSTAGSNGADVIARLVIPHNGPADRGAIGEMDLPKSKISISCAYLPN